MLAGKGETQHSGAGRGADSVKIEPANLWEWRLWSRTGMAAVAAATLAIYAAIFLPYLPNAKGMLGGDYSLHFPNLLVGYFWFLQNGPLEIPWFSPAMCGGFPYFPDGNVAYHSVPQLLVFFIR